jgi:hypothetical protein
MDKHTRLLRQLRCHDLLKWAPRPAWNSRPQPRCTAQFRPLCYHEPPAAPSDAAIIAWPWGAARLRARLQFRSLHSCSVRTWIPSAGSLYRISLAGQTNHPVCRANRRETSYGYLLNPWHLRVERFMRPVVSPRQLCSADLCRGLLRILGLPFRRRNFRCNRDRGATGRALFFRSDMLTALPERPDRHAGLTRESRF